MRMGEAVPDKVLAPLAGRPALAWALRAFRASGVIERVCLVARDEPQASRLQALVCAEWPEVAFVITLGGAQRADSVRAGLERLAEAGVGERLVHIHDGARPLVDPGAIREVHARALEDGAACLARRATDTLKRVADGAEAPRRALLEDLERGRLWQMETPQCFRLGDILSAYQKVAANAVAITDDTAAAAHGGLPVSLVESTAPNLKLTTAEDLALAEWLLQRREGRGTLASRVGFGYDVHRTVAGRPLVLGGVTIPCDFGLEGHSDADCLCHAVADAVLGALALPDIGHYFPSSDPRWAGMNSLDIVAKAVAEVAARGWRVGNVDAMVLAERPKLAPHIEPMRVNLAKVLGVAAGAVGIQATTHEGLGALGRGEGIAAQAVCQLIR